MSPLRILHVCPWFDPAVQFGGPVNQLMMICPALAKRGHDVRLLTSTVGTQGQVEANRWLEHEGYRVYYTGVSRWADPAPHVMPEMKKPMMQAVAEADVVHLHISFVHANLIGAKACRTLNKPYIYTPRSCLDPVRLAMRPRLKQLFLSLFERKLIRHAAAVHALTKDEVEQCLSQGARAEQCHVVPDGLPADRYNSRKENRALARERWCQRLGVKPDTFIMLFLGRLQAVKGIDILLDALATVHEEVDNDNGGETPPKPHLAIVGPDEGMQASLTQKTEQLGIAESVTFTGQLTGQDKADAYYGSDLFALTSHSEGMPNTVLESLATGLPVICSPHCHLPEVQTHGAGVVIDNHASRIAKEITSLMRKPSTLAAMSEAAVRLFQLHFELSKALNSMEAMYEQVMDRKQHG